MSTVQNESKLSVIDISPLTARSYTAVGTKMKTHADLKFNKELAANGGSDIAVDSQIEDVTYGDFSITNGYGQVTEAGVMAKGKGVQVKAYISIEVFTITNSTMDKWYQENKSYFSDSQQQTLEKNFAAGGFAGGVLAGMFGFIFGGGTYNEYENKTSEQVTINENTQSSFMNSIRQMTQSYVVVEGEVSIISTDNLPKEAQVFVKSTTITFTDSNNETVTLSSIDTDNPVAATSEGDTKGLTANGKLTIAPLIKG